jgi:hypothetical protein
MCMHRPGAPLVASCHSRLKFVGLLCREPGKRLKQDVPELVVAFEASQERKQKMLLSRAGEGMCVCVCPVRTLYASAHAIHKRRGRRDGARCKHVLANVCMVHGRVEVCTCARCRRM